MNRKTSTAKRTLLVPTWTVFMSLAPLLADAGGHQGFSEKDIRGAYSVSFQGEITDGLIVGHVVALGVARADGNGHFAPHSATVRNSSCPPGSPEHLSR